MRYPHTATITRPKGASGATDDFGQPTTAPGTETAYDGKADFQHGMSEYRRSAFGDADLDATGELFLPENADLSKIQRGDDVEITGAAHATLTGVVKGKHYLDESLAIKLTA